MNRRTLGRWHDLAPFERENLQYPYALNRKDPAPSNRWHDLTPSEREDANEDMGRARLANAPT
jgi:hypothetical protein